MRRSGVLGCVLAVVARPCDVVDARVDICSAGLFPANFFLLRAILI